VAEPRRTRTPRPFWNDQGGTAVALTERVSADLAYRNGMAIVTRVEGGLMYEASVGGQKLSFQPITKGV
jgi:hypothetical protein